MIASASSSIASGSSSTSSCCAVAYRPAPVASMIWPAEHVDVGELQVDALPQLAFVGERGQREVVLQVLAQPIAHVLQRLLRRRPPSRRLQHVRVQQALQIAKLGARGRQVEDAGRFVVGDLGRQRVCTAGTVLCITAAAEERGHDHRQGDDDDPLGADLRVGYVLRGMRALAEDPPGWSWQYSPLHQIRQALFLPGSGLAPTRAGPEMTPARPGTRDRTDRRRGGRGRRPAASPGRPATSWVSAAAARPDRPTPSARGRGRRRRCARKRPC